MGSAGWFLLGAGAAYLLIKKGSGLQLNANIGVGTRAGNRSFRGAQRPAAYEPLGTVGGFPDQDAGGFSGFFGFGASGVAGAANPQGYAQQDPAVSNGAFDPNGVSVDGNSYAGCLTGGRA
jgi:hypothetical protein